MAKFISDLRLCLQREHQFITNQKQLLGLLAKNVEAKLSNLYLISWFLTYLKENYDKVKNRTIQPIDFVKMIQYKHSLLNADVKLSSEISYQESPNLILTTLYQEPHIVALLFQQNERADKQEMLARIVYSTLYGGLLTAADEFLYLKVMMELLSSEFSNCKSSFELLQKGSGFRILFAIYLENSLDAKGFYLTVLQKQILFLVDEELFLEFEESKAEMHACQGYPGEGEYGVVGNSEEIKLKIKDSAEFMGSLITNLIKSLIQHLALTPYTVRVLANLLKREISRKWTLPVDAIQGCLANLIFGLFIVPVIADPATFGMIEDSILTDRIRSNLNCMATVLHNLPRIKWRSLSADLKLVFRFTNLDLYFSYIDSFVVEQLNEGNNCTLEQKASFFYKKLEVDRTQFLTSKGDLRILHKSISEIKSNVNTTLNILKDGEMIEFSQEKIELNLQTKKKKQSADKTFISTTIALPQLLMFPIKERTWDQPDGIEVKTEEEIMLGRKQVPNLRDISRDNSAIQNALKESYCNDGSYLFTRSSKTRQNSVSGFDTLRRDVCTLSSIDDSSEGSSSSEGEDEKSYEGDTSGIGSLANSNSSSYKANYKVSLKPPLPPYPSSEASISLNIPLPSLSTQMPSDSDSLEHSDGPVRPESDQSIVRLQRSASMGDTEVWEQDIYQNAEFLRKQVLQKKNNTLVPSPKSSLTATNSSPKSLATSLKSDNTKAFLRSKKLRRNARNIIKTVSTFGHHQKLNKRIDSLSLSKSGSAEFPIIREGTSTPVKDNEWVKLRSSTFTYMTLKSQQKPLPTSKYFTLLPLESSSRSFKTDMSSIIKRLRLVLSTCSFPDFNIPEPNFLPIEIQQQVSQLALISLSESPQQITMTEEIANKRSLISMLNHEFNMALSRNDIPQIALTSDLLHIVDIMSEVQVGVAIESIKKEYLARKEYIRYLTLAALKLSSQQEHINTYEKSILSQVEEVEKLFMDTEVRSFLLQNNTLFQLDVNLSLTADKPLIIQKSVYFTLEQMGLDPIWHNWLHHDALLYSIERNVYNHVYYGLFFPKGVEDQDDNELFRIRLDLLSKKLKIDDEFLAINSKYHFSSPWPGALQVLLTINVYRSPRDKLDVITNCCKLITNLLHFADTASVLGADEILPVLIYVIVNSNPKYLHANTTFLERYSESIEKGENAYWFNQFYIAINNLPSLFKTHGVIT